MDQRVERKRSYAMTSIDDAWLHMDGEKGAMVINAVLIFKEPLSQDQFRQVVKDRFLKFERFHRRPKHQVYSDAWTYCEVDEDYHLTYETETLDSAAELQAHASDLINIPLDAKRPLWRMHAMAYKRGTAVITRIHHCYGDGAALMQVLLRMMDEGEFFAAAEKAKAPPKKRSRSLFSTVTEFVTQQSKLLEALSLVEELSTELLKLTLSPAEENVLKKPGLSGKKQLVWTEPLELAEVKTIARVHGAKLNDVMLSSVAGAFRRYFKAMNQISAWTELRAIIPVDLRHGVAVEELGNYFGLVFLSLPLGVSDPIVRARRLQERMSAIKNSPQAWLTYQILQLFGYLPDVVAREVIRLFTSKASAVMSNVPGPQMPLHLYGNELEQVLFWVPQGGSIGVGVSILTYNRKLQFGLMTDRQILPQPENVIEHFNQEFESLLLETLMTVPWPRARRKQKI